MEICQSTRISMDLSNRLEAALHSDAPRARLQRLMGELLDKGYERDDLLPALETFRSGLAQAGRADDEDLILETIDGLTGWCNLP